jgi:molybdopterin-guanine dinucleotide biosynthesis protein
MKHREAGAEVTLVITAAAGALHFALPNGAPAQEALVEQTMGDLDLVLIEGWKERKGPKIEVVPADKQGHPRAPLFVESEDLLAVVLSPGLGETPELPAGTPCFRWDEAAQVAKMVLAWFKEQK